MEQKVFFLHGNSSGAALYHLNLEISGLNMNGLECRTINLGTESYLFRIIKSLSLLLKIKSTDIVILYGFTLFTKLDAHILRSKRCLIIFERLEYPYKLIGKSKSRFRDFIRKMSDEGNLKSINYANGFLTCTDALKKYYKKYTRNDAPFFISPIFVDCDKFGQATQTRQYDFAYIAYCGSMENDKDGVYALIEAYKQLVCCVNINLLLIGSVGEQDIKNLKRQIQGYDAKIILTGHVEHEKIPQLLSNAKILVLARPNNKQAEGGFPSKLGEYLATGVPVIVTRVGEIPNYIQDGVNGFLVDPDNIDMFSKKMKYVLDNYDYALKVGKTGQEFVKQFDYKRQGLLLKYFLLNLYNDKIK
jgi:glycosyltransferase involved in cell wall biosynthesis